MKSMKSMESRKYLNRIKNKVLNIGSAYMDFRYHVDNRLYTGIKYRKMAYQG